MVEVTVSRLGRDSSTNAFVVILKERGGERLLPIWIGQAEAESIAMEMNHIKRERPLTHDLCRSIIIALSGTLSRVQITRVQKSTYFAELLLHQKDGAARIVDARPSDSIALALRLSAPIFADDALLTTIDIIGGDEGEEGGETDDVDAADAAIAESELRKSAETLDAEQLKAYLENLRPEDFGKFSL